MRFCGNLPGKAQWWQCGAARIASHTMAIRRDFVPVNCEQPGEFSQLTTSEDGKYAETHGGSMAQIDDGSIMLPPCDPPNLHRGLGALQNLARSGLNPVCRAWVQLESIHIAGTIFRRRIILVVNLLTSPVVFHAHTYVLVCVCPP